MILPISFIVLIGLSSISCLTTTLSGKCLDYLSPLNGSEPIIVECPMVTSNDKRQTSSTPDNMFIVDFNCLIKDTVLCGKVENVFIIAGKFITATLNLKSVVGVNAQFLDFCATYGHCSKVKVVVGAAGPARLIPFQDPTDGKGKVRLYPQALYKQMNLPEHPQFKRNEIMAEFNSNMNYWFEGDPLPMLKGQVDMLYVVVHELIHGLGFATSWRNNGMQALTPLIGPSSTTSEGFPPITVSGQFLELIFDKHLVLLPSGKSLTSITDELNKFQINLGLSDNELFDSFIKSPQFPIAQDMYKNAVTHGAIGFLTTSNLPPNTQLTQDDVVLLETSLVPFMPTSSIAHVDLKTYLNSSDFLMMFTYPPGATLGQMMSRANSANTTGPIGPKLRLLLGILGYEVKNDYIPPVTLASSNKPIKNNSSLTSFNLVLSLICILLTFNYNIYFKY